MFVDVAQRVGATDNLSVSGKSRGGWSLALVVLLVVLSVISLGAGVRSVPLSAISDALWATDLSNPDHIVIMEMRVPRLIGALLIGASLAMAGAIMQIVTRNPLADPGLFGVNAGASMAVVLSIWGAGISAAGLFIWPAMAGAFVVSLAVYALANLGQGGASPLRMALAGAAVSSFLLALVRGVLLVSQQTLETYRFWVVGSLQGVKPEVLLQLWPFFAAGFVACLILGRWLNALSLGEDLAKSLGTKMGLVKGLSLFAVVCLSGGSVALAGPVAFVGLVVPHVARRFSGADSAWLLLFSALLGALFVLAGDILGRVLLEGRELQIGVTVALVGGPFFVYLLRKTRMMSP